MDILSLDVVTPADEGRPMSVRHPATGVALTGTDGKPVTISLRGFRSAVARDLLKQMADESAAMESQGRKLTPELLKARNAKYLTALTVGWSDNFTMGGEALAFSPGAAEKLWGDDRLIAIREQALRFVADDGSFITPSA
jgi:hypothetical protein